MAFKAPQMAFKAPQMAFKTPQLAYKATQLAVPASSTRKRPLAKQSIVKYEPPKHILFMDKKLQTPTICIELEYYRLRALQYRIRAKRHSAFTTDHIYLRSQMVGSNFSFFQDLNYKFCSKPVLPTGFTFVLQQDMTPRLMTEMISFMKNYLYQEESDVWWKETLSSTKMAYIVVRDVEFRISGLIAFKISIMSTGEPLVYISMLAVNSSGRPLDRSFPISGTSLYIQLQHFIQAEFAHALSAHFVTQSVGYKHQKHRKEIKVLELHGSDVLDGKMFWKDKILMQNTIEASFLGFQLSLDPTFELEKHCLFMHKQYFF